MQTQDFNFDLPHHLIARYPAERRGESRLLYVSKQQQSFEDRQFSDVLTYINPGDCLVVNHSRVMPALIWGVKSTGGKVECLIERILSGPDKQVLAHLGASKSPKPGQVLLFPQGLTFTVIEKSMEGLYRLSYQGVPDLCRYLLDYGHIPLPPYMERKAEKLDQERYQTVYANPLGSVAAPTAGLHFEASMLEQLKFKGVSIVPVTLHVGAGTFQPVRVANIRDHKMHYERISIDQEACECIQKTKQGGGRVIAVGTTAVRVLESVVQQKGGLTPFEGETNIFIYPGFQFQIVEALITNFHLPQSTLLMLVSAFAGRELISRAYQHAIQEKYRFYSYGDAMFIQGGRT